MSRYPVWWDSPITIYNKYTDSQTQIVLWYKHTLDNTFWKDVRQKLTVGETVLETNQIICRIRENEAFMEKHLWINLSSDAKANYFTLGQGDIIVKGHVDDVIDEYTRGHRSSDLLDKYKQLQGCFEINSVSINVGPGRGQPHYKAQGE